MIVLSLFDGMGCGKLALERAGVPVEYYYASEIDKYCMATVVRNRPSVLHLGDVKSWREWSLPAIDLLIGGSPCQDLSITTAMNAQGLRGEKSKLFYYYVDIYRHYRPAHFLLENVASMRRSDRDVITEIMGVEPHRINSNIFSAQDRDRLYWTNIPVPPLPPPSPLVMRDAMVPGAEVPAKYWYGQALEFHMGEKRVCATIDLKAHEMSRRVYSPNFKMATLTAINGGYQEKKVLQDGRCRKVLPVEYERLQTVPDDYTAGVSDTRRYSMLGNGWTVDVIAHIFRGLTP